MEYKFYYNSPIGIMVISIRDDSVIALKFAYKLEKNIITNEFTNKIKQQLDEYFLGERKAFNIKIELDGTNFQQRVWQELISIPYGQTKTYGEIAELIGKKNAQRAVGNACNKNPILLLIPCHRVIGKNGSLMGFAYGVEVKKNLLNLEKNNFSI